MNRLLVAIGLMFTLRDTVVAEEFWGGEKNAPDIGRGRLNVLTTEKSLLWIALRMLNKVIG